MEKSSDFQFWEDKLLFDEAGDRGGGCSPPFWRRALVDFRRDTSPLLPDNHSYSCLSPTSRLRAITDGRQELMEMMKDMPESLYELSLKDMVDDQQNMQEEDVQEKEVIVVEDMKAKHELGSRTSQQKSKYAKGSQICRTESMDSEVYLLKMFLPTSLSFNKKTAARKKSKISSGQSPEESKRPAAVNWRKITSLAMKSDRNSANTSRSASDISSWRTGTDENTSIPSRCPFNKKSKPRRRQGCLF